MGIKRYIASIDNTITNAFEENLVDRGTGSNMGASDILEVFSIYGQHSGSETNSPAEQTSAYSQELSRILIKFPVTGTISITTDRTNGIIPASGNVNFYLRMFNVEHGETLPRNFTISASAIQKDWEEGTGLDMEYYQDKTYNAEGSNWINFCSKSAWAKAGGDFYNSDPTFGALKQTFDKGTEDLEIFITPLVEEWIMNSTSSNGRQNYGLGLFLTASNEAYFSGASQIDTGSQGSLLHHLAGAQRSYYTKRFFGRGTEFFFKRPVIEARWDSSRRDHRGSFYLSSSLVSSAENLQTLYLYNNVRGQLRDIPTIDAPTTAEPDRGKIYVSLFSGTSANTAPSGNALKLVQDDTYVTSEIDSVVTGGWVATGIYSASFATTSTLDTLYDVWFSGGDHQEVLNDIGNGGKHLFTGSITPLSLTASYINPSQKYVTAVSNLRAIYSRDETARFRLFTREKDWNPNIYTKAIATPTGVNVESGSYRVLRTIDNYEVISYGTGSDLHTVISYDNDGNYFDLDMGILEKDYSYTLKFAYYNNSIKSWVEQPEIFKFRVEE